MGVHGLWELLAPVGRRVSVETLAGKRLAIDASIWMVQFMKAMRDDKGEMVRNAHLLGFFRRICKLLFLRTKPVFVFDGGTPALKRRTVIARRRQRENAQAKIRKTAEKLLLNHLKSLRLKELANDIETQRRMNASKGKKVVSEKNEASSDNSEHNGRLLSDHDQEKLDEMLAASIAAEEKVGLTNETPTSKDVLSEEDNEHVDIVSPKITREVDPALLDALPAGILTQMGEQSTPQDSMKQQTGKGKNVMSDEINLVPSDSERIISRQHEQEKLDAMLAASIAAEEGGSGYNNASTSSAAVFFDDEDNDADEEMIVPEMQGTVDRAVLDSLPLSMRLDLFAQMKERQMAENRQKYQEVKKAPDKFSELQIQSYLKAVALRREINQVQKAAAGIGVGGVRTSRIASEANREFIFSSSFTGDKDELVSAGVQKDKDGQTPKQMENPSADSCSSFPSTCKSTTVLELAPNQYRKTYDDGVETFLDEMGRIRVSRVRAMGVRMTRDLQRNLDLMKEIELDQTSSHSHTGVSTMSRSSLEAAGNGNGKIVDLNETKEPSVFEADSPIQISFENDGEIKGPDGDEDVFARLVAGSSSTLLYAEKVPSAVESFDSASDADWEEGMLGSFSEGGKVDTRLDHDRGCIDDVSDVEWEEELSISPKDNPTSFSPKASFEKRATKGSLEEDAELQEAIRRSLEDKSCGIASSKDGNQQICEVNHHGNILSSASEQMVEAQHSLSEDVTKSVSEVKDGSVKFKSIDGVYVSHKDEPCAIAEGSCAQLLRQDVGDQGSHLSESALPLELDDTNLDAEVSLHVSSRGDGIRAAADGPVKRSPGSSHQISAEMHNIESVSSHLTTQTNLEAKLLESSVSGNDLRVEKTATDSGRNDFSGNPENLEEFVVETNESVQVDITSSSLEDELRKLSQECEDLGIEQKKLERNAESVSSEMFTECQELLQMFGLPYIIAPMEAEAQCAYLELANLVDGVVTDDSDVFLFGAGSVYKNIFDDRKYVETYFMKDIEKELGMSREKLIRMALLLGSDYTEGISGIGIVNAVEVLNAFPEEDGLQKFREWVESPDASILGKVDRRAGSTPKKRGSRSSKGDTEGVSAAESQNESQSHFDEIQELKQYFMDKHRNVSKNWHIPSSFPCEAVLSAYISPQVDKSAEPFSWGKPDIFILRKLCWEKFGWSSQKADELLVPVLKEYNKHETQLRLEAFYTFNERFAKIRSKRIKKAVKGISGKQSSALMDDTAEDNSRNKKKRKGNVGDLKLDETSEGTEEVVSETHSNNTGRLRRGQSRKRKASTQPENFEENYLEAHKLSDSGQRAGKRTRGNGRGGGRGRIRRTRRVGRTSHSASRESEDISGDDSSSSDVLKVGDEKHEGVQDVWRSQRCRKAVNYVEELDADESHKSIPPDDTVAQDADGTGAVGSRTGNHPSLRISSLIGASITEELASGFCADEADMGQCGQHDYEDGPFGDDYLKTGGGFCVEDEETNTDPEGPGNLFMESPAQNDHVNFQNPESPEVGKLSAMPFLRRKHKKT